MGTNTHFGYFTSSFPFHRSLQLSTSCPTNHPRAILQVGAFGIAQAMKRASEEGSRSHTVQHFQLPSGQSARRAGRQEAVLSRGGSASRGLHVFSRFSLLFGFTGETHPSAASFLTGWGASPRLSFLPLFPCSLAVVSDDVCGSGNYTVQMSLRPVTEASPEVQESAPSPETFLALIAVQSNSSQPVLQIRSCCVTPSASPGGPGAMCCLFRRSDPELQGWVYRGAALWAGLGAG